MRALGEVEVTEVEIVVSCIESEWQLEARTTESLSPRELAQVQIEILERVRARVAVEAIEVTIEMSCYEIELPVAEVGLVEVIVDLTRSRLSRRSQS